MQQFALGIAQQGVALRHRQIGNHHRKGLVWPALALPQSLHRLFASGIAGELKAPQPLDRQYLALTQQQRGPSHGLIALGEQVALAIAQCDLGTALGASVWLGVKAAIEGIIVLALAVGAHAKVAHGRPRTVIGHVLDDRESRPAISAVGKGIAIAPVCGIADLALAVGAGGDIGRDQLVGASLRPAVPDLKALIAAGGDALRF